MDELSEIEMKNLLKELGLPSFELRAYLYLLKARRGLTAQEISSNAHIPLTRVYGVMVQLEKRGFISINRLSSPTSYYLKNPQSSLRFMLKKQRAELNSHAEKLEGKLENLLQDFDLTPHELPHEWNIYYGDDLVYKSLIPSLVAGSKREVLLVGSNVAQTMTQEFLEEFRKTLDKGTVFKTVGPLNTESIFTGLSGFFDKIFGIMKLDKITREHWGKNFFMRKSDLSNITPFGIFDKSKVGFSIASPKNGRHLVTLVTDMKDVVDEFYELFQNIWETSTELAVPRLFAKLIQMR